MVIYFTGTGNSRYCAKKIAAVTEDTVINAGELIKSGKKGSFSSEKPYVFVAPTYSWQLPRVFDGFLREAAFSGSRKAYFVMTCGDDIGCAGVKNKELCEAVGLTYMGTAEIKMPENYIAMFDVPDEKSCAEIMLSAHKLISQAGKSILGGEMLPERKRGLADKLKTGPVNTLFYRLFVNAKAFRCDDRCISCGRCEKLCPMNTVKLVDGRPQWGEGCTHCMACISYCPEEAIEYGRKSVGKRKYRCKEEN